MEFRKVLALRGPNVWANFPVLEAWVDLGELDKPSTDFPGFNERLMSWMPSMIEHRCSIGQRGGFFQRLRTGTYPGHILEHVTLELQTLAGTEVGFGKARETSEQGVYKVVIEYIEETVGRECLAVARELFLAAIHDRPFNVGKEIERLRELAQQVCLGPSTRAIVQAAEARNIPYRRLNTESLVLFGHGRKQRRIQAAETDRTSAIAEAIAQDKEMTRMLFRAVGVPTPYGRPVKDADDAWATACEIGVPVVVKPQDGNQGRGVATNLTTREQIVAAYEAARKEGESVLVEKFAPGHDYRLLVVGDRVVAAARREPAQVLGDGIHTVAQLVELVNADPRRGEHHATVLSKIKLDAIALAVLADQGFTPDSVPPAGATVLIRRNANLSTGGTAIDVTERVHPAVAACAVDAAKIVGLDVAGVDVVAQDISRPLNEQGGVIVEVNAAPGLRMHLEPSVGISRPVGEAIVDMLFPAGENGRIPIVAVTGVNGKTTTTRFIAHILRGTGKCVGMTCTDGIFVNDRRIDSGDCSGPQSARSVLMNPSVEMAVFETARGGMLREGLAFDYCDVAVVTNIGEGDHLGLSDINTPEELAKVKRCIVEAVAPTGHAVLNANDPLVVEMAAHCPGEVDFLRRRGEPSGHRAPSRRGRPGRLRPRPPGGPGRRRPRGGPPPAGPPAADAQRSGRLPGGKLLGVDRRRLVAGHTVGRDPRPRRIHRRRHRQGARPVQRAGDRGRHGGGRLRPQHALAGRRDRGHQHVPAPAPHVRLLDRRRPPRLRHHSPGRVAGRGLRSRDPLRGPLPPRPHPRRDRRPVPQGAGVGHCAPRRLSRWTAPRRRPKPRSRPPSPANWCSCRPTRSTRRSIGSAAIWRPSPPRRRPR